MPYDFVPLPERRPLRWPDGARLALMITFNLEHWDLVKETDLPYYAGGPPALPDPRARLVGRQTVREQRVHQDVEIPLDRRTRHPGVPRDTGDVDHLTVEQGRHRQKTHEPGEVAHQRLGPDLLAQVQVRIGLEHRTRIVGDPHQRDRPEPQHPLQVEVGAEFRGREREHRLA